MPSNVKILLSGAVLATLAACSSAPPPNPQIAAADAAVREAEEAQAPTQAPAPLRRARTKLQEARNAFQAEDFVTARRLAEQAQVDAQLAEAQARSKIAQESVAELQRAIDDLRRRVLQSAPTS